jgi:hypothetical protein
MAQDKTTEWFQQTIQTLRSSIEAERGYYTKTKAKLELLPEEWNIVHEGIVAVANYYNGEIVRVKHDLADFMSGHEIHGTYGDLDIVKELHTTVDQIPDLMGEHDELVAALEMIEALTTGIEERSYAER